VNKDRKCKNTSKKEVTLYDEVQFEIDQEIEDAKQVDEKLGEAYEKVSKKLKRYESCT